VHYWTQRTEMPMNRLVGWLGLARSTFYDWRTRYGLANEHNAPVPRDFWLEDHEKIAIVGYARAHPLEGYRRLAFMMLDADIATVRPSSVCRVLAQTELLGRWTNSKVAARPSGPDATAGEPRPERPERPVVLRPGSTAPPPTS